MAGEEYWPKSQIQEVGGLALMISAMVVRTQIPVKMAVAIVMKARWLFPPILLIVLGFFREGCL